MRQYVISSFLFLSLSGCISTAKYEVSQRDLEREKTSLSKANHQIDSISSVYNILKSDYNNLAYEFSETEKYVAFTNSDLVKELEKKKIESEKLATDLRVAKRENRYYSWLSEKRAESFAENAQCTLEALSARKYILQKANIVFIDTEGLMLLSKGDAEAYKTLLIQLVEPIKNRTDWKMNICLTVGDPSSDWKRMTLQNEMMAFFAAEAGLPSENLASITRIVPQQKSPEFGYFTNSRLLVEIEFKG